MTMFLVFAALMIAAALAFVIVPMLRHARHAPATADIARRLRALEEARASGLIDDAEYAKKRNALDIAAAPSPETTTTPRSRATFATLLAVALVLPLAALFLYRLVGTPDALDPSKVAPRVAEHTAADMDNAIAGLAARLKAAPDDAKGWALLARAYQATNRLDEARDALKQAHEHAPDDNDVAVEYAQAIALASADHRLAGESRALLEAVLAKDASNQRALWLVGISEYQDQHYDAAIARWKTLLPLLAPESDVARSVRNEIADAEARRDGREPPAPETATAGTGKSVADDGAPRVANASQEQAAPDADAGGGGTPTANAPHLKIAVSIDAKLKDGVDGNATLFVFARAESGPPMPLAIQRLKASALPTTVTLDDSMSMMPAMKLSKFPRVIVGARVSKSGNAMPQSGDLQGFSAALDPRQKEPVQITIRDVVP
jgi:cytochrome c-type biogenesis protein CcmH